MTSTRATFLHYLGRHRRRLLAGMLLAGAGASASTIPPRFIGEAIDALGSRATFGTIASLAVLIVLFSAGQASLSAFGRYLVTGNGRDIEAEMRADLFAHLQRMHLGYFQHQRIGDLMARMTNDLNAVRMMLSNGFMTMTSTVLTLVFAIAAMTAISVRLTVISMLLLPLATVAFLVAGRRIQRLFRRLQAKFGDLSASAQENLSGIRVVKSFGQEEAEIRAFAAVNEEYVGRAISLARTENLVWPIMEGVLGTATLAALYVGGQEVIGGHLTLGQIVQFVAYLRLLAWPMEAIGWVSTLFQTGWASLGRLQEVYAARPAITDPPNPATSPIRGELELRDVAFSYGGSQVLEGISAVVPAGGSLAIVGPTGSGKSTLVNLLPRLMDVRRGQVLVDGRDVRDYPLDALRGAIGIVPQETFLFSTTLRANIGLGRAAKGGGAGPADDDLTDDELATLGGIAQLDRDVAEFPAGYDTLIGERGVTLSGGQRQRVAIARAVARDPRILVLDDALSAVDTSTEAAVLERLRGVMAGRTSIIVAHRISTVRDADQILVLDGGRVVERGTHAELVALDGWYADMHRRQLLEDETAGADRAGMDSADDGADGATAARTAAR